jgi:tetratricopeptide (TPR) repeat protein
LTHGQKPLPKADPKRFAIAVANLGNDPGHHFEDQLVDALRNFEQEHDMQAVQILRFDREISYDGTEESESVGNLQAQNYLTKTGAQVIIWGTILGNQQSSAYRLCWTTLKNKKAWRPNAPAYQIENFRLPSVFWHDLVDVLHLMVVTQSAQFFDSQENFIANKLRPFVMKVRNLFNGSQTQAGWDMASRSELGLILASELETLGEQSGEDSDFEEAISVSKDVLEMTSRERVPLQWAAAQNSFGIALWMLGEYKSEMNYLEEAVTAYDAALREYTRGRAPFNWAMMQNNLGLALAALGEREVGTEHLIEAVTAYRFALQEYAYERALFNWAGTQNNLGNALAALGEREVGTEHLAEAVSAYRTALQEYTHARNPLDWAMTQLNLGRALRMLGERETGTKHLEEAVASDRAALQEYSREQSPQRWTIAQLNLGVALTDLGKREGETKHLAEAVAADGAALQECPRNRMPRLWAIIESNLCDTLAALGDRETSTEYMERAVAAGRSSLQEYTPEGNLCDGPKLKTVWAML